MDPILRENQILRQWQEQQIFKQTLSLPSPKGQFVFFDGPPFATGLPHYGNLVPSIIKDLIPRYFTMRGYQVPRRWGWDCHGLPIENLIEKELGLKNKQQIENLGIDKFNQACRASVLRYAQEWKQSIARIGRFVDMDDDYKTMNSTYISSVWSVFKKLYQQGLAYQGYKSMHLCPRCETTLSNFEVAQSYQSVTDLSVYLTFEVLAPLEKEGVVKDSMVEGQLALSDRFLVWTTTPWTLGANVALAVNPELVYQRVEVEGQVLIIAQSLVEVVLADRQFKVLGSIKGQALIGQRYRPLWSEVSQYLQEKFSSAEFEASYQVYGADFVNTESGTGVVHIAPAFGEDDLALGQRCGLPVLNHLLASGRIRDDWPWLPGQLVKKKGDTQLADRLINKMLAELGVLFKEVPFKHNYPTCWRCETPLLNYVTESWFIKVTALKDKLLATNQEINWVPDHLKDGRFGNWLLTARDWAVSRTRFWGAPLPVWICEVETCQHIKVVGSIEELPAEYRAKALNETTQEVDLHRPQIDQLTFKCPACQSGNLKRVPDVFDCWFESGSMPYAPQLSAEGSENGQIPNIQAEFISEGLDQTRGWFYTLHVLATALFGRPAFKNVVVHGMVLASDGKKMSKHLKNYPDPQAIIEQYGADALRYYLLSSPLVKGEYLRFRESDVSSVYKKLILILSNVTSFYQLYQAQDLNSVASSAVDDPNRGAALPFPQTDNLLDRWQLAKLQELQLWLTTKLDTYQVNEATRAILPFVTDLSTWYLRSIRARVKAGGASGQQAVTSLGFVLQNLAKLIAPFTPFVAEHIYSSTGGSLASVHLEAWPHFESELDQVILKDMAQVRDLIETGRSLRATAKLKLRQPLAGIKIKAAELPTELTAEWLGLIKSELNLNQVQVSDNLTAAEGWLLNQAQTLALDTNLTPELKLAGQVREFTRLVNAERKKRKLQVADQVKLNYQTSQPEAQKLMVYLGKQATVLEQVGVVELKDSSLAETTETDDTAELDQGGELLFDQFKIKFSLEKL